MLVYPNLTMSKAPKNRWSLCYESHKRNHMTIQSHTIHAYVRNCSHRVLPTLMSDITDQDAVPFPREKLKIDLPESPHLAQVIFSSPNDIYKAISNQFSLNPYIQPRFVSITHKIIKNPNIRTSPLSNFSPHKHFEYLEHLQPLY